MKKPNIILISIDTLRADHLSCYGYSRSTTPNLDALATEGILFKNAYSTAVWTPPAHASMLTGLYPNQHGVVHQNRLPGDIPTLAEILQANGYQTAGFVNNSQVGELVGLHRGHGDFYEIWRGFSSRQIVQRVLHRARTVLGTTDHGAARTNELIFDWLAKKWQPHKPFYLFIHHIDAHNPLKAPRPFRFRYLTRELRRRVDMTKIWRVADNPLVCFTENLQLNETEVEALKALYDETIAYLDFRIGELVRVLRKLGLLDQTLLIITADHGEHFGEKKLYSHVASLYEPIVHIPLLLRFPPAVAAAEKNAEYVQHIDIVPTVLEAAEIAPGDAGARPGISLLQKRGRSRAIFAEWEGRMPHFVRSRVGPADRERIERQFGNKLWMCRRDHFKLIAAANGHLELYNTQNDPGEQRNLARQEPARLKRLQTELQKWLAAGEQRQSESYDYSEAALKKHLQSLGYL